MFFIVLADLRNIFNNVTPPEVILSDPEYLAYLKDFCRFNSIEFTDF